MKKSSSFASIDEYIASTAPDIQLVLEKIRQAIRAAVPEAAEAISYKIPAFKRGGTFIYFAAFKSHIGIYPPVNGSKRLASALLPYRGDKGNLKFPLNQPIPYDLIGQVASALSREYAKAK